MPRDSTPPLSPDLSTFSPALSSRPTFDFDGSLPDLVEDVTHFLTCGHCGASDDPELEVVETHEGCCPYCPHYWVGDHLPPPLQQALAPPAEDSSHVPLWRADRAGSQSPLMLPGFWTPGPSRSPSPEPSPATPSSPDEPQSPQEAPGGPGMSVLMDIDGQDEEGDEADLPLAPPSSPGDTTMGDE
ncbi:hypothetical protein BJ508DRAFT_378472 [Ascobolus immersus RN42]|uniref:Uncharacterized protein n=1 Tax=Ascobolus immersus RN42 TaxID=1160509 RepID=A0A3N4HWX4_ASCIM|nr:hypothetical protein BJ508DRAFT_378472 [Ascobolus immersus RN42]